MAGTSFLNHEDCQNPLRNKLEDEFLCNYLILCIKKEIAQLFSMDSIINEFGSLKECKVALEQGNLCTFFINFSWTLIYDSIIYFSFGTQMSNLWLHSELLDAWTCLRVCICTLS